MSGLVVERPVKHFGGVQRLYRYPNGYGASVVRHEYSYGGAEGFWELAVIEWTGDGENDWGITYATPVSDDVIGWLSDHERDETLAKIEALPTRNAAELYRHRKPGKAAEKGLT